MRRRFFAASPLLLLTRTGQVGLGRATAPKSSGPASGTLLIVGGGTNSRPVIEAAQYAAGGQAARWVVIPSAQTDRQRPPAMKS